MNLQLAVPVLCTVKLSRRLVPAICVRAHLDSIIERHGIVCTARHRALATRGAARSGGRRVSPNYLCKISPPPPSSPCSASASCRRHLPPELADELPDAPGVYRDSLARTARCLYVGRAAPCGRASSDSWHAALLRRAIEPWSGEVRRVDWYERAANSGPTVARGAAPARSQSAL